MKIEASSVSEYISKAPKERQAALKKLRSTIKKHIPKGFKEGLNYGMPGYVVPLKTYPAGYLGKKDVPLPFLNFASQKNFIAFYHSGVYADPKLKKWWDAEYAKRVPHKLDMGKSCVRFKKVDEIPYDLIAELLEKISVEDWIALYEKGRKK